MDPQRPRRPTPVLAGARMRSVRLLAAARSLGIDRAIAELAGAFSERGVDWVLLKGPAFAQWLYDDPLERTYQDADVLIRPEDFPQARAALDGLGFSRRGEMHEHESAAHHEEWFRAAPVAAVELHFTLSLVDAPAARQWQVLTRGRREMTVAEASVPIPSEPVQAFIVAMHAAHHGPAVPKVIRDLTLALARVPGPVWNDAALLAAELEAGGALADGLRLAPGGAELARRLGIAGEASDRVRLRSTTAASGLDQLLSTPGAWPKLRRLGEELVPSPDYMRLRYPGAAAGRAALGRAYLRRTVALCRAAPGAVRAVSAARRLRSS